MEEIKRYDFKFCKKCAKRGLHEFKKVDNFRFYYRCHNCTRLLKNKILFKIVLFIAFFQLGKYLKGAYL